MPGAARVERLEVSVEVEHPANEPLDPAPQARPRRPAGDPLAQDARPRGVEGEIHHDVTEIDGAGEHPRLPPPGGKIPPAVTAHHDGQLEGIRGRDGQAEGVGHGATLKKRAGSFELARSRSGPDLLPGKALGTGRGRNDEGLRTYCVQTSPGITQMPSRALQH